MNPHMSTQKNAKLQMSISVFQSRLPLCSYTVLVSLSYLTSCLLSCEKMRGDSNGGSQTACSPALLCWHKRFSLPSWRIYIDHC